MADWTETALLNDDVARDLGYENVNQAKIYVKLAQKYIEDVEARGVFIGKKLYRTSMSESLLPGIHGSLTPTPIVLPAPEILEEHD